jgi:hypothetical protein
MADATGADLVDDGSDLFIGVVECVHIGLRRHFAQDLEFVDMIPGG